MRAIGDGPRIDSETEREHRHNLFGAVYANELARIALLAGQDSTFPTGSTIVRERLLTEDGITPEALTVMVKRERGFNPDAGDWEFLMVDGAVGKVEKREKRGDCLGCHVSKKSQDFTFRTYE